MQWIVWICLTFGFWGKMKWKEKTQMFIHLHHLSGIKQVDWFFVFFLKYFLGIEMKLLIQYGVQSDETSTEGWNKFNFVRVYLSMCLLIWKKEEQFVFCLIFVLSILYLQTQYNYLSKQFARLDNYILKIQGEKVNQHSTLVNYNYRLCIWFEQRFDSWNVSICISHEQCIVYIVWCLQIK